MRTRLEQFIRDNRDELDADDPPDSGWERLHAAMQPRQKPATLFSLKYIKWAAAAVIVLFSLFIFDSLKEGGRLAVAVTANAGNALTEEVSGVVDPAFTKQVNQFAQLIQAKQKELAQVSQQHPALYQQFLQEVQRLDSIYRSLKIDLAEFPSQDILLDAMIQNLQLQVNLLNRQLQIAKQLKNTTYESKSI